MASSQQWSLLSFWFSFAKFTRTRDDAATAIVLSVSFGLGITLISGMVTRGVPGSGGLERFLLGHTASLTVNDALLLGIVSVVGVLCIVVGLKEATLVAFDSDFAAAAGWPAATIDLVLIGLIAVMVVVGLPAAGAVLVTAGRHSSSCCQTMDRTAGSNACYCWSGGIIQRAGRGSA